MAALPEPMTTLPTALHAGPRRSRLASCRATINAATPHRSARAHKAVAARQTQGTRRGSDRGEERSLYGGGVVQAGHGEAERRHPRVMHEPDAESHAKGSAGQPSPPPFRAGHGD